MSEGLSTTFRVLAKTENEAAVRVLLPALDSPHASVQEGALRAILARRSPVGGRELIRRLETLPPQWEEIIRQQGGRMNRTLRDAILDPDRQMCANGCRAAVWLREYDLIATLLNVLEDQTSDHADLAAATLWELVGLLYEEMAGTGEGSNRRDPQLVRRHVVAALESSVKRFGDHTHNRREVIESFLLLVGRDNVTLQQILQDPHHPSFLIMVDVLSHSNGIGVIRLLLSYLDDPHVPSAVLTVIGKRSDAKFVRYFLRKIGRQPSDVVAGNLKRMQSITWLSQGGELFAELDEPAQHGTIQLAMHAGIPRREAFVVVEQMLLYGEPGARREAAAALGEFPGADANNLALKALDDPDPKVQANVLAQLRQRGIPGVLPRMLEMIDSPHAIVRQAARSGLDEFSFPRYVGAFDMLDDDVRYSTGMLVKKIDPQTVPLLKEEMGSRLRTRRIRGLAIARTIEMVAALEETIAALLGDEDHLVRSEAAMALAEGTKEVSINALTGALGDTSTTVREAARKSLRARTSGSPLP